MIDVLILSIALSIDAMIVSFSQGLIFKNNRLRLALTLAFFFGLFQALMPLIGAFMTGIVYNYVAGLSKWIVFAVFVALGVKFLFEALKKESNSENLNSLSLAYIFAFAISTSIDALFAGVPLRLMNIKLFFPLLLIGAVTFFNSLLGFSLSNITKNLNSKSFQIVGALLLIALGVKEILF